MNGRVLAGLVALGAFAVPATAAATWSIAAVDPDTGEVGVSVASCVPAPFGSTTLPQVAGVVPGIGALAAQAQFSQQTRDQAVALLAAGNSPQQVIDMVVAGDFQSASRQYGAVTLDGQTAGFTGAGNMDWAGDLQATNVTVQGNILVGPEVAGDALTAFEAEAPQCPWALADRLMVALEAGAAQGGDRRCDAEQSALAAVIIVARPGDDMSAPYLDLRIPSQMDGGDNPVALLRDEYDQWRLDNPPDDAGCFTGTSTGDAGGTGDGPSTTSTSTSGDGTNSSGSTTGNSGGGSSGDDSTAGTTTGAAAGEGASDDGCGCSPRRPLGRRWLPVVMVGLAALRRRR